MKLKTGILYTAIAVSIALIFCAIWITKDSADVYAHVFKTEAGYGYAIIDHGQILIRQEHIPAISDEVAFCSEEDAEKVGELVLKKINRKINPALSQEELKDLGIQFNCHNE
ncbi:DUF4907 domain-containing protein [Leeuwenhoekiella marinoflava]|uniref:DUF4907 domain-containing protein n=1 Tax=Leeuwenhoekiella marinoflava TaxID=988 RepID=UPI003001503A